MEIPRFRFVEIRPKTISWEKILPSTIKDSFSVGAKIINAKTDVASVLKIFDPVGESSLFWLGEDLAAFNGIPTSTTVNSIDSFLGTTYDCDDAVLFLVLFKELKINEKKINQKEVTVPGKSPRDEKLNNNSSKVKADLSLDLTDEKQGLGARIQRKVIRLDYASTCILINFPRLQKNDSIFINNLKSAIESEMECETAFDFENVVLVDDFYFGLKTQLSVEQRVSYLGGIGTRAPIELVTVKQSDEETDMVVSFSFLSIEVEHSNNNLKVVGRVCLAAVGDDPSYALSVSKVILDMASGTQKTSTASTCSATDNNMCDFFFIYSHSVIKSTSGHARALFRMLTILAPMEKVDVMREILGQSNLKDAKLPYGNFAAPGGAVCHWVTQDSAFDAKNMTKNSIFSKWSLMRLSQSSECDTPNDIFVKLVTNTDIDPNSILSICVGDTGYGKKTIRIVIDDYGPQLNSAHLQLALGNSYSVSIGKIGSANLARTLVKFGNKSLTELSKSLRLEDMATVSNPDIKHSKHNKGKAQGKAHGGGGSSVGGSGDSRRRSSPLSKALTVRTTAVAASLPPPPSCGGGSTITVVLTTPPKAQDSPGMSHSPKKRNHDRAGNEWTKTNLTGGTNLSVTTVALTDPALTAAAV